jgi:hypothetical protein
MIVENGNNNQTIDLTGHTTEIDKEKDQIDSKYQLINDKIKGWYEPEEKAKRMRQLTRWQSQQIFKKMK